MSIRIGERRGPIRKVSRILAEPRAYHSKAVDELTQLEVVGCAERITERYLVPTVEATPHQFPFVIVGFQVENGSEYVNHTVAKLLNKQLVELTRSRPIRSSDNALVKGKNGL